MIFLLLSGMASYAQTGRENKTSAVFRFNAQSGMFYERGNAAELKRLYDFVELHKAEITGGQIPVHVAGYCASFDSRSDNLKTAAVRANRVKSELITRKGLAEKHFITANHAEQYEGMKDAVVVSFDLPQEAVSKVEEASEVRQPADVPAVPEQPQPAAVPDVPNVPEPAPSNTLPQPADEQPQAVEQPAAPSPVERARGEVSIRTNLLYWAIATPNIGLEWKPSNRLGILVNGAYSHLIWNGDDKRHRTWLVQPEVRWYFAGKGKKSFVPAWFVGAEFHAGQFNFKFGDTGYQGDAIGGGLTGGYRIALSKCFDMDFSLGLGYTNIKYDTYYRSNGVSVKKETGLTKDFFGPTQAGVSLIFKL